MVNIKQRDDVCRSFSGHQLRWFRRIPAIHRVLLVALAALFLLLLLRATRPRPQPPPWGEVLWEDDVEATAEPYLYVFSTTYETFYTYPPILVSELSQPCLPPGSVTVRTGGRLGNLILEYASLWTAARLYNLSAFVPRDLSKPLEEVFEPLELPDMEEFLNHWTCPEELLYEAEEHLRPVDFETTSLSTAMKEAKKHRQHIVFDKYTILPETMVPLASSLRVQLQYRPKFKAYAQETLEGIRRAVLANNPRVQDVVFAGVHVRRTDYHIHLRHLYDARRPADERYYGKAALWLQHRVVPPGAKLVLVLASDDPDWVHDVLLPHLHSLGLHYTFMPGNGRLMTPEYDLALLSSCNHSVISYGTFGIWTALSAGGRAVVYHLDAGGAMTPAMQFAKHMPGWVAIK